MKIYHIDELGRRKNPKQMIESEENKRLEQAYIKLPGKNLINVSLEDSNKQGSVVFSGEKIKKVLMKYKKTKYSDLHTHCKGGFCSAFPDYRDLKNFLVRDNIKTMFIAQTNQHTGKVEGVFCLRKTKKTKPLKNMYEEIEKIVEDYRSQSRYGEVVSALKKLVKKYDLKFRHLPVKGYELDAEKSNSSFRFVKKSKLEKIVIPIIVLSFLLSIFFLSSNLIGFVVSDLSFQTSNLIGVCLFILGTIGLFILKLIK